MPNLSHKHFQKALKFNAFNDITRKIEMLVWNVC